MRGLPTRPRPRDGPRTAAGAHRRARPRDTRHRSRGSGHRRWAHRERTERLRHHRASEYHVRMHTSRFAGWSAIVFSIAAAVAFAMEASATSRGLDPDDAPGTLRFVAED